MSYNELTRGTISESLVRVNLVIVGDPGRQLTHHGFGHCLKAAKENVAVVGVAVTDDVSRCCRRAVGLGELAGDPFSRWVRG